MAQNENVSSAETESVRSGSAMQEWIKPAVRSEDMADAMTGGSDYMNLDGGFNCAS